MPRSGLLPHKNDKRYTRRFCKLLILHGQRTWVYLGVALILFIRISAHARAYRSNRFFGTPRYTVHPASRI